MEHLGWWGLFGIFLLIVYFCDDPKENLKKDWEDQKKWRDRWCPFK